MIREKIIGVAQELQDEADRQVLHATSDLTDFDLIAERCENSTYHRRWKH